MVVNFTTLFEGFFGFGDFVRVANVRSVLRRGQSVHLCICAFGPMPNCLNDKTVVGDFLISLVSSSQSTSAIVVAKRREIASIQIEF